MSCYIRICSISCECDRCTKKWNFTTKHHAFLRTMTLYNGGIHVVNKQVYLLGYTLPNGHAKKNNEAAYCWIKTLDYYRPFKHYKLILIFFCNFKYKKRIFKYTDLLGIWYLFHLVYQEKLNNWLTIIGWVLLLKVG